MCNNWGDFPWFFNFFLKNMNLVHLGVFSWLLRFFPQTHVKPWHFSWVWGCKKCQNPHFLLVLDVKVFEQLIFFLACLSKGVEVSTLQQKCYFFSFIYFCFLTCYILPMLKSLYFKSLSKTLLQQGPQKRKPCIALLRYFLPRCHPLSCRQGFSVLNETLIFGENLGVTPGFNKHNSFWKKIISKVLSNSNLGSPPKNNDENLLFDS